MNNLAMGVAAPVPRRNLRPQRDVAIIVVIAVAAAIVCAKLNLSEALLSWTRPRERFQLDELPAVLLVVAVCLVWFSARRYLEARRELALRRNAETQLAAALAENRRLTQQYLEMQESERRAIARDLHDELGQYLNVIKLDAVSIRDATAAKDARVHQAALGMIQTIDRVHGVVTGLIRELRPVGLDELGLAAALEHCVDDWRRRLPLMTIELSVNAALEELDDMRRLSLYRLVQEALTNVARHSQATRVLIRIGREAAPPQGAAAIVAVITDNGVGADLQAPRPGLGLVGMRERVVSFGGSLQLASARGDGFALTAHLPIAGVQ
jgi:two-component system sensor histidine kinase UhpB